MRAAAAGRSRAGRALGRPWVAVTLVAALHVAVLAPLASNDSFILDAVFRPDAEAVLGGARPYAERDFEYPPLALPLIAGPAAVSGGAGGYRIAFGWEMIGFDLAIVALLALALRGRPRAMWGALAVWSAGLLALGRMPLARFDLVPAALVLAAVLARRASRSASWPALLAAGAAVKVFPLLLAPAFAAGERRPLRAAFAAAAPLAAAVGLVLALGDEFGSAIGYHAKRDLQIEALAATPLLIAHQLGAGARTVYEAGSFNLAAPGAGAARLVSIAALGVGYLLALSIARRRRLDPIEAATLIVAALVVLAPVLSPQFLLWILPLSAAAFGLGLENALLLAAVALTRVMQETYDQVETLGAGFVWSSAARNALLAAYLAAVAWRLAGGRLSTTTPSSSNTVA